MKSQIRCVNPACVSFLRIGKEKGNLCDCCEQGGKESELSFLDQSSGRSGRSGKSGGGMFVNSHIRYNGK